MKLHNQRLQTVEEIRAFVCSTAIFDFEPQPREEACRWMRDSLCQLRYTTLGKAERGLVRA